MISYKQQGAALFVALIILLIVSMMGVSAMKGGIFHERMAFNAQSEEMTFQAAETAIGGVIQEARQSSALLGILASSSDAQVHCFSMTSGITSGACSDSLTLDSREALQAQSSSKFDYERPLPNSDAAALMDFQFHTIGSGKFKTDKNMPFENHNLQEWRKIGPGSKHFSVDPRMIGAATPQS